MRSEQEEPPNGPARLAGLVGLGAGALTVAGFAVLFLLMLSLGVRRGVNHDESQHLAAGAVFGRGLLLPYRDFPYFHMPDLALIYGALFRWCGSLLLAARVFSVVAGWLTCVLVWILVRRECRAAATRWLLPAAAVVLLFSNPIFRDAFWRTWNHALATLFGLGAVALVMRPGRGWRWFGAGVCIGLALGTRLTFAPLAVPLAAAAIRAPDGVDFRRRIGHIAGFCAGGALALIPSLILFAMAPAQFIFGNFTFNSKVNVLFRQSYHDPRATLRAKLLFPVTTLCRDRSNILLAVLFVVFVAAALVRISRMTAPARYRLLLVLSLIPFTLIGVLAPTPSQHEYYYALVPLLVLAIALSAAQFCAPKWAWICPLALLAAGVFTTKRTWDEYQRIAILKTPSAWPPVQIHEAGGEARQWAGTGRVLTLSPLFPLEGGLDIYPALVTGVIAWRVEPFATPADRARYRILGPDNFAAEMQRDPPAAVLSCPSTELDGPLIAWARAHGYAPHLLEARGKLVDQTTVWTPAR
jgi:hypothetical protein